METGLITDGPVGTVAVLDGRRRSDFENDRETRDAIVNWGGAIASTPIDQLAIDDPASVDANKVVSGPSNIYLATWR
jgi:enhancing lycopene biosynthesis protein 2